MKELLKKITLCLLVALCSLGLYNEFVKPVTTVESVKEGIKIYENSVGVLTNNPPFDKQMFNLNNYMHLSAKSPENNFSKEEWPAARE